MSDDNINKNTDEKSTINKKLETKEEVNEQVRDNNTIDTNTQNNNQNTHSNSQEIPNQQQQQEQPGFFSKFSNYIYIFIAFQIVTSLFGNKMKNGIALQNIFDDNTELDVQFYIEQSRYPSDYDTIKRNYEPIWTINNLKYTSQGNDTTIEHEIDFKIDLKSLNEKELQQEGLFLYAIVNLSDKKENTKIRRQFKQDFDNNKILIESINLLKFSNNLKETIRSVDIMNDIESTNFKESSSQENSVDMNSSLNITYAIPNLYYKPEIYFYLTSMEKNQDVTVFQELNIMGIKPTLYKHDKLFLPYTYLTDFWTMLSELKPVEKFINQSDSQNITHSNIKVKINFKFITMFYFKYMRGIEMNSEMMENNFHVPASKDLFVELLKNNSAIYLTIMLVVNLLHSVFSFLGFASDITYYKNLKQLDGLYTKHLFFHLFHLAITFLYVYIEGANFIVKIELFVALAIEIWKFRKIFELQLTPKRFPYFTIKYKINFRKNNSKNYETEAVGLMMKYIFGPVAILYLSYRIYYYKNLLAISLFKFVIEYIFFLMNLFGFILLTPQIYLNYKLKSVKHLPLKALTYKFLNTIIDDLYAFAVKTPTLYRVFCFKDDLIFVIYIIQIVIYRNNRRNENDEDEGEEKKIEMEMENKALTDGSVKKEEMNKLDSESVGPSKEEENNKLKTENNKK